MLGLKIYKIAGQSMAPTLEAGQFVLARSGKNVKPKDIVICRYDNQLLVKRIKSNTPGGYMVQGDNKKGSRDSRDIGLIYPQNILGKVLWY